MEEQEPKKRFTLPPIHPFVFALLPLLKVWNVCLSNYLLEQYIVIVVIITLATIVLLALFYWRLKNLERSALVVTLLVATFYFWIGFRAVARVIPGGGGLNDITVMCIYLLLCANAIWVINRWAPISKLSLLLNLFSIVTFFAEVVPIATQEIAIQQRNQQLVSSLPFEKDLKLTAPSPLPDIYFILVDAYGNSQTLTDLYKYDSQLIEHLKQRGFFIADKAEATHDRTSSSMPSTLNMQTITELVANPAFAAEARFRLLQDNQVARLLKGIGYKTVNVSSGWEPTDYNPSADVNVGWAPGGNLHLNLLQLTLYSGLEEQFKALSSMFKESRTRAYNHANEIVNCKGPKFVVIHSLLAHPPFFLDRNGNITKLSMKMMNEPFMKDAYIEQLRFCDSQISALVDRILDAPGPKPIIIIESDHGPASTSVKETDQYINERMRILAAFYLPAEYKQFPPENISAVNTFRWLFDTYFGAKLPMLPNQSWVSIPTEDEAHAKDLRDKIIW